MFDSTKLKLKGMMQEIYVIKEHVCASCEPFLFFLFCMVFTHVHSCFNLIFEHYLFCPL
jgi:hypothetical protein